MKLLHWVVVGALGSLALTGATSVLAEEDIGWYVGVTANRASADFEDENDVDFDDSDTALGIRGGYMFTDIIGVEVGYLDLGDFSARGDNPGNRIDLDADAFSAALVLNWSVHEQVDLYGKVGAYFVEANSDSVVAGATFREDEDETEAYGAIGAEWDFGQINLFGEISKVDTDVNDLSIDIVTLGVKYEF